MLRSARPTVEVAVERGQDGAAHRVGTEEDGASSSALLGDPESRMEGAMGDLDGEGRKFVHLQ